MNYVSKGLVLSGLAASLLVTASSSCCAYIDAGTGSLVIQAVAAGVFCAIFVIKGFWAKIKNSFARIFSKKQDEP